MSLTPSLRTLPPRTWPLMLACLLPLPAMADELVIPVGEQGADRASLERPHRAMKAEAVEAKFGAPLNKSEAVGNPPISHWEYPEYQVYFEGDRVLHSVLKPIPTEPLAAPPAPEAAAEVSAPVTEAVETPVDSTPAEGISDEAPTAETAAEVE